MFQASTALRHIAETVKIVRENKSSDYPIQLEYTDSVPDHNTTFWTVKIAHVLKFDMLDLDLLVAARTVPAQSYANMAKRSISLLNLALLTCAFARSEMPNASKEKMKSISSMRSIR